MNRKSVLWIADWPGWGYDSIARGVGAQLSQYDHRIRYACKSVHGLNTAAAEADIVVVMYARYLELLNSQLRKKAVVMLTGFRPFEVRS